MSSTPYPFPDYNGNVPQMSSGDWGADSSFKYSLISNVYEVAKDNLDQYFKDYRDMKTFHLNEEDLLDFSYWQDSPDAGDVLDDNLGSIIYIGVWLILTAIFTIVGIVWCVCNKCCCCCKRSTDDLDLLVRTDDSENDDLRLRLDGYYKKEDKRLLVKKVIVGVLMGLWIIGFTFGVFMSFASNENIRKSISGFYDDVSLALDDAEEYRKITNDQITATFVTSYGQLGDRICNAPFSASYKLAIESTKYSEELRTNTEQFLLAIGHANNNLVRSDVDEGALGGLGHSLEKLREILVQKVDPFFITLMSKVNSSMQDPCQEIVARVGADLKSNSMTLINALNDVPIDDVRRDIDDAEDWLDIVKTAVYSSFMLFNVILLIILISVVVGSVIMWIGKGSAKRTGSIFYRASIALMFAIGWIVALTMITQFAAAGMFTHVACEAVRDLENNVNTRGAMQTTQTEYVLPTYGHVMSSCKKDMSAYSSFNLKQVYDAETIFDISDEFGLPRTSAWAPDEFFIKEVEAMYSAMNSELKVFQSHYSTLKEAANETLYSRTEFLVVSIMQNFKVLESGDIFRSDTGLLIADEDIVEVDHFEQFVYGQVTQQIGRCRPLYNAANATIHTFCYKLLAPVATYWWALQILLLMFVTVIVTALLTERIFK